MDSKHWTVSLVYFSKRAWNIDVFFFFFFSFAEVIEGVNDSAVNLLSSISAHKIDGTFSFFLFI